MFDALSGPIELSDMSSFVSIKLATGIARGMSVCTLSFALAAVLREYHTDQEYAQLLPKFAVV